MAKVQMTGRTGRRAVRALAEEGNGGATQTMTRFALSQGGACRGAVL